VKAIGDDGAFGELKFLYGDGFVYEFVFDGVVFGGVFFGCVDDGVGVVLREGVSIFV
jgi:hypothetical protein